MTGTWAYALQRAHWLPPTGSWAAWIACFAVIAVTMLAKFGLDSLAGQALPAFITFYPAVMAAAYLGGPRIGVAASLATALIAWYIYLPPQFSFAMHSGADAIALATYALTSALIGLGVGVARLLFDASLANHAQRDQVVRESVHRIKNLISVVSAMDAKIAGETDNLKDYRSKLGARLAALALAQDVLVRRDWEDVQVEELIRSALAPFLPNPRLRVEHGPHAMVPARHVSGVCMALYELCTNSMKYGALAGGDAPVIISWRIESQSCVIDWREQTPAPVANRTESFGTQLIRAALGREPSTEVRYDVDDRNVQASFRWLAAAGA